MKIAFLNDGIYAYASCAPEACGGAERQQWLLARALAARNWSVAVGVREAMDAGKRRVIYGVQFVGIGHDQILRSWYRFLLSERPDWWYWRCANHVWGAGVGMAHLLGVHTVFSTGLDRDVEPRRALFLRPRCWPLYACGLSLTDRIFVQNRKQLLGLPTRWQSKAYIIPSIAGDIISGRRHRDRDSYVAWVGDLRYVKRADLLIDIARRMPAVSFVVCGGPSSFMSPPGYGEQIVRALRAVPNIEYRGPVPPDKAQKVIAEAAVYLSTSDEEGFPNTFLQAWSSGTPVISLKIDPDFVIQQKGLGIVPGNLDRLIVDMKELIDSPEERDEIAHRARRYIVNTHSEAAVIEVFQQALQRSV